MQPKDLEKMPLRVESLFYDMQNRVMSDVVRRINKTGGITSTADYQLNKMEMFGNSSEYIESEIKRLTGKADAQIWKIYDEVIEKEYTRNKSLYEQVNANFIPYDENEMLQSWTKAIVAQTGNEIKNITQSMGFTVDMGRGKKAFTPLAEYYQKYLDKACMDVATGSFDYNTVLRRVVKEMTASGIRTVDYASGWTNRVTVASRRAVMTGVNQLCGKVNDMNAEKLRTDYFEVTAHANARPSHRNWQGRVFTKQQLVQICGLGSVDGLEGANCRHQHLAFVPSISARTYTDQQLGEMAAKEDEPREWNGKQYKGYEATQEQRRMETVMRKQRGDIQLLRQGKADESEIMNAQSRYLNTLHQYQSFAKNMELKPQMERVYMDGLGRMTGGKKISENITAQGEKKLQRGFQSRAPRTKQEKAKEIFSIQPQLKGDVVMEISIYKELDKTDIGKGVLRYIEEHHTTVDILYHYETISSLGMNNNLGMQMGNHIYINAQKAQTKKNIAKTLIHEEKHLEFNIGGDQHAECVCDYYALQHEKGKLTGEDIRGIIKSVKERYSDYKWRW